MLITIVRQLWAALSMIRATLALRVAICSDAARNTHREQLFACPSPQRLGPDNGGSWYEAIPFTDPHENILDRVPVQEAITECEFANAAKCILHDSHDWLIRLRRNDLAEVYRVSIGLMYMNRTIQTCHGGHAILFSSARVSSFRGTPLR